MSAPAARPLKFGEIIEAAARLYPRLLGPSLLYALAVAVPYQIAAFAILAGTFPEELLTGDTADLRLADEDLGGLVGGYFALVVVGVLGQLALLAVLSPVAVRVYTGRDVRWPVGPLLLVVGAMAAITIPGLILCFVGIVATWLFAHAAFAIALPMLATEDLSGGDALRRSWELVRPRFWWVVGVVALGAVLLVGAQLIVGSIPGALAQGQDITTFAAISSVAGLLATVLTAPLLAGLITVLFFDLRLRGPQTQ